MKKLVLMTVFCFMITNISKAQQLEWYNTILPKGQPSNSILSPSIVTNINSKIILSGLTLSKSISLYGSSSTVLTASNIIPDAYFLCFDDKGQLETSQIIYTPNGNDGLASLYHNKSDNFIYSSFSTTSDSIRFTATMPWIKVTRKNANTYNSFIIIYDNSFNYVSYIPCVSYNGCQVGIKAIDKAGNIYLGGTYKDSLMFNGKLLSKSQSIYSTSFIMKLDNNNNLQWINENGNLFYLNETRNSFYILGGVEKNMDAVIKYNKTDSLVFYSNPSYRTIIAEFAATTGHLKQYTTLYDGEGKGFSNSELKGDDKTLLLNRYTTSSGLIKLKIGSDSFSYMLSSLYSNNFIIGFDASNLRHKFINFFDSSVFKLNITDIYNDSLYSIIGNTGGNQNFGFNGQNAFTKDHIKTRPVSFSFPSDFYASYTTTNRLKDLWYLNTHPSLNSSVFFYEGKSILANSGNIYIAGTIQYHSELGLGKHEFSYAGGGARSLTLLKYNCKPTAYFSYTQTDNKVTFKNLSTGLINYTWLFGQNNEKATTKDAVYNYPKSGGVFYPKLIASNSCGNDTFSIGVTIALSSVSKTGKSNVSIYPNPASSKIIVQLESELNSKNMHLTLFDLCGKNLICPFVKIDNTHYELDVEAVSNGIYYLSFHIEGYNVLQKITVLK